MQTRASVPKDALHLRDEQIALGEEGADVEFVDGGAFAQDAAGEVDGGEGEGGEEGRRYVDAPAPGLHFCYAADDEIADFGGVARAEGQDGEEFVGFVDGAGDGGEDCGGLGGGVGAVASVWEWISLLGFRMLSHRRGIETGGLVGVREGRGRGRTYLIHCGSSVTVSPGVTMDF